MDNYSFLDGQPSQGTYGEETLDVFDQFQNYREILDNRPNFALLRASKK